MDCFYKHSDELLSRCLSACWL